MPLGMATVPLEEEKENKMTKYQLSLSPVNMMEYTNFHKFSELWSDSANLSDLKIVSLVCVMYLLCFYQAIHKE